MFSFMGAQKRSEDIRRFMEQYPILGILGDQRDTCPPDVETIYVVNTPAGRGVWPHKADATAYAEAHNAQVTERKAIFINSDTCLLLDAKTPVVQLGIPESQEEIRNRAISKLSEKERKALGL